MTVDASSGSPTAGEAFAEDTFAAHKDRLFGLAYRMSSSVAEAEDVCQETFIRWARQDQQAIQNPEAWLVTVTTRLCVDRARSATTRRVTYVGPWLPEPLPTERDDPESVALMSDSLTFAFLVMLDHLSPRERAALLLHDVFGYDHTETASTLGCTAPASRQLVSRARAKARAHGPRTRSPNSAESLLVEEILGDLIGGNLDALLGKLAPEVVLVSDGGAHHRAARRPVLGQDRVGRLLINLAQRPVPDLSLDIRSLNGSPSLVVRSGDEVYLTLTFELGEDHRVLRCWALRNPDKLEGLRE